MQRYENYHKHTHYSNLVTLDVIVKPEDYMKRAKELGQKIYFTTEHGYTGNIYEAMTLAEKYDLKVVAGMEAYYVPNRKEKDKSNYHLVIVAMNMDGYRDLNYLLSGSNVSGFYYKPRIDDELLFSINPKNVVVTTACVAGRLREEQGRDEWVLKMKNYFGDHFFLETQAHPCETQANHNKIVLYYHKKYNIPIIHADDSHYIYPEEKEYREMFLKAKGINYPEEDNFILDYPDTDTVIQRYKEQGVLNDKEIQEALNNTLIFDQADNLIIDKEIKMPHIFDNPLQQLKKILNDAWLEERKDIPKSKWEDYLKSIREEVKVVEETNMAEYFVLNYYLIKNATENHHGVITRTGRGSAPSFYINKLLGFTNIDRVSAPIKLFPSRFMSKTRILTTKSLPDIDFNCADTEPFYESSKDLLGRDGCYWMIAYKPLQVSSGFRLWCKAKGLNINEYNDVAISLAELSKVKKSYTESVYYSDEKWKKLIDDSQHFVGVIESVAMHPCSTLLLDKPISREVGLIKAGDTICANITSYESDVYKYLKNDLLTVMVWDIINKTCKLAGIKIPTIRELEKLLDDKTWDIYSKGLTCSINQVDSDYATQLVKTYKPHSVAEMSAFVAIIRPGCASLLQDFIHRKPYTTGVPKLDELLKDGSHRMIYQELIMRYLIWLGVSEDDSYGVIKKIAKKKFKKPELDELKAKLLKGWIKEVGTEEHFEDIWQIVEDASRYSFNCISGDTKIQRLGQKKNTFNPTIKEMYLIMNDSNYAKETHHVDLHKKYKSYGYGNAFSMFDDNRIHKNEILNIYYTGKQSIYKVKTESGAYVDCTLNHKFPTPNGEQKLENLKVGDLLYVKNNNMTTRLEKIVSIEYLKDDDVYDIEMSSPAHTFVSESGLVVSNCSHSLAYAYDSLYGAYLKSHYPLEYYTVALNFYQGDFERTTKLTQELDYFKIKISSPKFRYSFGEYACDKKTNTIYKGISSIKGLSKTIGDKLYALKDKHYNTFLDLLIDCKENNIGIADITTLAKLDYFSEFGKIGKILQFIDIYNELYGKKVLKKDKEYKVKTLYLKKFCSKETEKQMTGFDSYKCLSSLISQIPDKDIPITEKIQYQLQYFGYIDITDQTYDKNIWIVTACNDKGKNHIVELYRIYDGANKTVKVRNKVFSQNSFEEKDLLRIDTFDREGKWTRNNETKEWTKSTTEFEDILNNYQVVKEN